MFHCHVCGSTQAQPEKVNEVFFINGKFILVEAIPALVCQRCGEYTFSRETTEQIRLMVHSPIKPIRSVKVDVLTYA